MSSAVGGGAARATSSPQEQLSIGKALLQQKKYTEASEALSVALEMFVQAFGEVGAECAEVYATRHLRAKRLRAKRLPTAVYPVAKHTALCASSTSDSRASCAGITSTASRSFVKRRWVKSCGLLLKASIVAILFVYRGTCCV